MHASCKCKNTLTHIVNYEKTIFAKKKNLKGVRQLRENPRISLPFKRQIHKMVKHTQTNRRQIADDLFECV